MKTNYHIELKVSFNFLRIDKIRRTIDLINGSFPQESDSITSELGYEDNKSEKLYYLTSSLDLSLIYLHQKL